MEKEKSKERWGKVRILKLIVQTQIARLKVAETN